VHSYFLRVIAFSYESRRPFARFHSFDRSYLSPQLIVGRASIQSPRK
jgi:hypothetical protein